MSRHPVRVTGFTRFFIVMLFVAPLAFIGASYYNGQDGIQNLKKFLKLDKENGAAAETKEATTKDAEAVHVNEGPSNQALQEENKRLKEELEFKNKRNDELYRETEELKRKLESAERALDEVKK